MGDNHNDNAVELLGAVQLAVMNATGANARIVRAQLSATLRKLCAETPEKISRLSDAVFAESDFLLEMAWTPEPADPALFEPQRQRFALAMDRLIYEVGVMRIRPSRPAGERPVPNVGAPSYDRFSLGKIRLVATLTEWVRKTRGVANRPTPGKPLGGAQLRRNTRPQDNAGNRS